jgi:hypothetical protein
MLDDDDDYIVHEQIRAAGLEVHAVVTRPRGGGSTLIPPGPTQATLGRTYMRRWMVVTAVALMGIVPASGFAQAPSGDKMKDDKMKTEQDEKLKMEKDKMDKDKMMKKDKMKKDDKTMDKSKTMDKKDGKTMDKKDDKPDDKTEKK